MKHDATFFVKMQNMWLETVVGLSNVESDATGLFIVNIYFSLVHLTNVFTIHNEIELNQFQFHK